MNPSDLDILKGAVFAIADASRASAKAAHDARQPEVDSLKRLIVDLVKQMEDAVDLDKPSFADPRCYDCTHGTTPNVWGPRSCAYHRAKSLLSVNPPSAKAEGAAR